MTGTAGAEELGITGLTDVVPIGTGPHGRVYRATQPALRRTVAVKVFDDHDEAAAAGALATGALGGHPNIAQVHASGVTADGRPYVVMEHLAQGSLADLAAGGGLDWREVPGLVVRLAAALETAHRAGLVHGAITAHNVLFSSYGEPQLADFRRTTGTGSSTPPAAVRADVAALGSALAGALGSAPDDDGDGAVPRAVRRLLAELVEPDGFATAGEAAHAAQRVQAELGLPVTPLPLAQTSDAAPALRRDGGARRPRTVALAVAAGVVLLAIAVAAVLRSGDGAPAQQGAGDLGALLITAEGLDGTWTRDDDLAAQVRASPDEHLCAAAVPPPAVRSSAAAAYRAGTPGPRIANVVRGLAPGAAAAFLDALRDEAACLSEGGGLTSVRVQPVAAGDAAVMVRYVRPSAQLPVEIVLVHVRRGDTLSSLVHLGYPRADRRVTDELVRRIDAALSDRSAAHGSRGVSPPVARPGGR